MTQEQTGMSQWDAGQRLGELLTAPQPTEDEAPVETSETDEIEASEEAIDEPVEDIEAADEEHESDEAEEAPDTYTVVVAGEDVEVTLPELIAGYSRQQDYTRKTQAVAEDRKALEMELTGLRQERQQYAAALPRLHELLESTLPERPNPADYTDPMTLARDDRLWQEQKANIEAVTAERQRIADQQRKDAEAQWQATMQMEETRLLEKIPEWQDKSVRSAETQKMTDYLRQQGYTEQEVGALVDHRAVLIARKAMAYDGLNVKAKAKPKRSKTVAPGTTKGVKRSNQLKDTVERAKQSGSEKDAARAFAALLG